MANPNNLIRPPILNTQPPPNPDNPPNPINFPQMEAAITNLVTRLCREQCRNIVGNVVDPGPDFILRDQEIEEQYRTNLGDLDKVPDVVRCLREFSGNAWEFSSWKKSVERVLNIYETQKGTPKYFGILNVIRNKIIGAADSALESYNTPLCWEAISKCLTLHYADKRDVSTLEYQLTTLVQGNSTVQDFYQEVYSHLSLIINNITCMTIGKEAMETLIQTYRDKALDTFIRGLRGDLSKLLCIREPTSLPQALHLCLKLQNQNFRTDHALSKNSRNPQIVSKNRNYENPVHYGQIKPSPQTSHITPLQYPAQHRIQHQYPNHYPTQFPIQNPIQYPIQYQNQNPKPNTYPNRYPTQYQYNIPPPRPNAPKPQPKPVPMETETIQTRNVNYMNRPRPTDRFMGKRPLEQSVSNPQKFQRNFNIETIGNEIEEETNYINQLQLYDEPEQLPPLNEYVEQIERYEPNNQQESIDEEEFADIHFLE